MIYRPLTKKQIDEILLWPSSYERFETLFAIRNLCKGKSYWYALRKAYYLSDNLYKWREEIKEVFKSNEPFIEYLMTKKERDFLDKLPEVVTIYRGMTDKEFKSKEFGVSWTLDKDIAKFFADTYARNHDTT